MLTQIPNEKSTISIIGCGLNGVLHAFLFAEAGYKVKCVDPDQIIVNNILHGKIPLLGKEYEAKLKNHLKKGTLDATSDIKAAVSQSNTIIITTMPKIDERKKVSYSNIENICKQIGLTLRQGSLIIITSTVGVGITQSLVKETLENTSGLKVGTDFGLAYSPLLFIGEQPIENMKNTERIVAGIDDNSLNNASNLLERIGKIKKVTNLKLAEAAALLEATKKDIEAAVTNEFTLYCEKMGIDLLGIQSISNNCESKLSSIMVACENVDEMTYILLDESDNQDLKLRIPAVSREINEDLVKHVINLTREALRVCGKTLKRARISLLGFSLSPHIKIPSNMVKKLAITLEMKGARISLYDPYISETESFSKKFEIKRKLTDAFEGADCIIIARGYEQFKRLNPQKIKVIMKMPAAIVDLEGVIEPKMVEEEGFVYRGLGRGIWTK